MKTSTLNVQYTCFGKKNMKTSPRPVNGFWKLFNCNKIRYAVGIFMSNWPQCCNCAG